MAKIFETDEDRMIDKLRYHRDTVSYICDLLKSNGIQNERTIGNSPQGDILVVDHENAEAAKSLLESQDKRKK